MRAVACPSLLRSAPQDFPPPSLGVGHLRSRREGPGPGHPAHPLLGGSRSFQPGCGLCGCVSADDGPAEAGREAGPQACPPRLARVSTVAFPAARVSARF